MARIAGIAGIAGIDLSLNKRVDVGLTYVFGIGLRVTQGSDKR